MPPGPAFAPGRLSPLRTPRTRARIRASSPAPEVTDIDSKTLAATVAHLADEKKAEDIQVIEVGEKLQIAEYFVVITGQNRTHVRAIHGELHVRLKAMGEQHKPVEGSDLGWWIVLDYGDVVVHILQPEAREYYDLENLYGDCPLLDWQSTEVPA